MRLWTVHPKYLDAAGLVALWREALLAKAVLSGRTVGYRHHPQLVRFREAAHPIGAINTYLRGVHAEAERRGYHFSVRKIAGPRSRVPIKATRGQLTFEWSHLLRKLRRRSPSRYRELRALLKPRAHPQFAVRAGPVSAWEKHGGRETNRRQEPFNELAGRLQSFLSLAIPEQPSRAGLSGRCGHCLSCRRLSVATSLARPGRDRLERVSAHRRRV